MLEHWHNLSFTGRRPLIAAALFIASLILLGSVLWLGIFLSQQRLAERWSDFAATVANKISTVTTVTNEKPAVTVISTAPARPVLISGAVSLSAKQFSARHVVVRDSATGQLLFGKAAYEPWPMASVTKLLSALTLLDIPLNFASSTLAPGDQVFDSYVVPGGRYRNADLWNAALIASSNRAVIAMVDSTGLSRTDFVAAANAKARQLGMTGTVIVEPTGLDPRNHSTAADIAVLLGEALKKPQILESVKRTTYNLATVDGANRQQLKTTDWLLSGTIANFGLEIVGGKTGYIPESGYNFVAETVSSTNRVVVVVLGAASMDTRFTEARLAAQWAYQNYLWK